MNLKELQACPACKSSNVSLNGIITVLDNVRYDDISCNECKTRWRLYYSITDAQVEIVSRGANTPECTCEECGNHTHGEVNNESACECEENPDHECRCKDDPNHVCKCENEQEVVDSTVAEEKQSNLNKNKSTTCNICYMQLIIFYIYYIICM